jgi:hypothetical protein
MRVSYSTKKSQITIRLSWAEAKQFVSNCGIEAMQSAVRKAVELTTPTPKKGN